VGGLLRDAVTAKTEYEAAEAAPFTNSVSA